MQNLRAYLQNDDGASLVEYATIVMMAAIFALAALRSLGTKGSNVITNVGNQLS